MSEEIESDTNWFNGNASEFCTRETIDEPIYRIFNLRLSRSLVIWDYEYLGSMFVPLFINKIVRWGEFIVDNRQNSSTDLRQVL